MLEAIIDTGGKILSGQNIIDSSIVKVNYEDNKENIKKIIFINFDTRLKKLSFDYAEMDEDTVYDYLHLGRSGGPNACQYRVTFTNPVSLISEVISQLRDRDMPKDIKQTLDMIIKDFFYDFGEEVTPKYRFMLDMHKSGITEASLGDIYEKAKDKAKPYKEVQSNLQKELQKYLEKFTGAKSKQIGLYTLCIDGTPIAFSDWYKKLIEDSFKEVLSDNKNVDLCCSYCGSTKGCTSDLSKMSIKYYTTNQVIFANNFDRKNYDKNMVLCKSCKDKLYAGENFIQNNMRGRISKLDVYIIPHIIYSSYDFRREDMFRLSEKLNQTVNMSNNIVNLERYKNELKALNLVSGEGNCYLINLVFYKKMNQATKILKLVKDIDPGVFERIGKSINESTKLFEKCFAPWITNRKFQKGLNLVYYMTPVKLSQKSPVQYQSVLSIYEALFYGRILSGREIISNIVRCLKINWFEQGDYNVSASDSKNYIDFKIADGLFYMMFMENMGNIERGEPMDTLSLNIKENYKNFINDMGYDEQKAALFLLGCLVGAVGRKQNSRDADNKQDGNKSTGTYKPVLNKLNFNGMNFAKVKRLSNHIFEKLRQEKILMYYEAIFSVHKTLLGINEDRWKYNKDENLYYILSGYAFETMKKKEKIKNE